MTLPGGTTLQAPVRCSALADELDEPMIGTADHRPRWLLIEDRSAWGTEAVEDLIGADAAARAKADRLRVGLVRRREGDPADDAQRRAILVDTVTRAMAVSDIASVAELDIGAAATLPVAEFGAPFDGPMALVCTNGKRDACCALRGRALVQALAETHGEWLWETSHLGGHRFAANLVCLPDGIIYGRVRPADGPRLLDAYRAGRLDATMLRGRSAWPAPVQVAERELRLRLGLDGLDDVRLVAADVEGARALVTLETSEEEQHRLELMAEAAQPPRATSCRGDKVEAPIHWRLA